MWYSQTQDSEMLLDVGQPASLPSTGSGLREGGTGGRREGGTERWREGGMGREGGPGSE